MKYNWVKLGIIFQKKTDCINADFSHINYDKS
jgi:hypothetical protein